MVTPNEFAADWRAYLPGADMAALSKVVGRVGAKASSALASVRSFVVTFDGAEKVFYLTTLPKIATETRRLYPGTEKLPPDAAGALVSLVYNRGTRLEGDSRREMKAIRALVPEIDMAGIAAQLRSMKRLWDPDQVPGSSHGVKRRRCSLHRRCVPTSPTNSFGRERAAMRVLRGFVAQS